MASGDAGARKRRRLSRSGEFDRVYREGSSHANRFLVVYSFPRSEEQGEELRLGVSVGRKVGGLPAGHDFVLVARAEIGSLWERAGTAGLQSSLREALDLASEGDRLS